MRRCGADCPVSSAIKWDAVLTLWPAQGTGEVFPLHDEAALAAAMVRFARDPEQRHACGTRARALIQDYSIASAVEGTVNAVAAVKKGSRA